MPYPDRTPSHLPSLSPPPSCLFHPLLLLLSSPHLPRLRSHIGISRWRGGPGSYVCKVCNEPGHWIYDCPQKSKSKRKRGPSQVSRWFIKYDDVRDDVTPTNHTPPHELLQVKSSAVNAARCAVLTSTLLCSQFLLHTPCFLDSETPKIVNIKFMYLIQKVIG